jgi:CubicO group peptidase (beta-lactamase class C family)
MQRSPALWLLAASTTLLHCTPDDERVLAPDVLAQAEAVYRSCVEDEVGIEIATLRIAANGTIDVLFADGYSDELAAQATALCEPRLEALFERSTTGPGVKGRPASDAELAALLERRADLGFQGVVIVESRGRRRLDAGFGTLSMASARSPDGNTAFDCGSIMKEVTAATLFLLEEDGALSREQTLDELFDDVPAVWRDVTLGQLIDHSAGFDEYHDSEGDFEQMDRATALEHIFGQEPLFQPGSERAYSNSGYTLLAAVVERVSGEDFRLVVRRRVFEPLGMSRSGFYGESLWADGNVATGSGALVHGDNDPASWPAPTWALLGNGGLVSTAEDLLRLARGLEGDVLFRESTRAAFRRAQPAGSIGDKSVVGYAGGNDYGFNAVVGEVTQDATYVIAASHVLSPITAEWLAVDLLEAMEGERLVRPEAY